jgi:hypothetical protein
MIELKPETERLVHEELQSGRFSSADEIILQGIKTRREREYQPGDARRHEAVNRALEFARHRAVALSDVSIKALLHEGHDV